MTSAAPRAGHDRRDPLNGVIAALAIVGLGLLLGLQYVLPDKRVLAVLAAGIVFGIAWRLSMVMGIGVLILALPFPRTVTFGTTNMAFVLLLLVIWLLRFATRTAPPPRATPLDGAIVALFLAYVVSFYNVTNPEWVRPAFNNFFAFTMCVLIFYLIVNNTNSVSDMRRLHTFAMVSMTMVYSATVFELLFPGRAIVPGWIQYGQADTEGVVQNLRVGGPFSDYELLSEYCALNLVFLVFVFHQARSQIGRLVAGGLLGFTLFILFATVTRGALVALGVGIVYALILTRRRLQVVPFTILVAGCAAAVIGMEFYVTHFTKAGSIFDRFAETKFVGYLPDSRAQVWPLALERWMKHPIIGWGPFYTNREGINFYPWPHNLLLYVANCLGVIGLGCFLFLMWKLWKLSKPDTDWIGHPSYARAYLLIAHVQLVVFFANELKIEYLRNPIYQYVVWVFFAFIAAGHKVAQLERRRESPSAELARAA